MPINPKVIFIGDSITAMWGDQPGFQAHTEWINKGIRSEGSQQIAMRFQTDVIDQHPGTVHILAGTNDVYPGWILCNPGGADKATAFTPPGPATLTYSPDTCSNMLYMVETAKRNRIRVVIGTIPPWGCSDNPVCWQSIADTSPERYDRVAALNQWLKQFSVQEGIMLIDYHALLTNSDGRHYASGLTEDGVHPDPAAYQMMQPAVESVLH